MKVLVIQNRGGIGDLFIFLPFVIRVYFLTDRNAPFIIQEVKIR